MIARLLLKWGLPLLAGLMVAAFAESAAAQCCEPPPPPCCEPPPPPPPPPCCEPPPPPPPCCHGGNVNINVNVNATANASAYSRATASAIALGRAQGYGYAYFSVDQPAPTVIHNLVVEGAPRLVRTPYTERRRTERHVVIQAVCIDARSVPHPASRLRPDRDVSPDYEGELYRCLAGTWLQATIANYEGEIRFDGGDTLACRPGEALYHGRGGRLECRPQTRERDCFERSLLRRYGAGVYVLTMVREEEYTEYREEMVVETVSGLSLMLDGGVGGRVH